MPTPFSIEILEPALQDIEESGDPERLFNKIEELKTAPTRRGKALRNELTGYYSLRAGDYRIIYEVEEQTVWIYGAGLRKEGDRDDIYERARRWFAD